MEVEAARFSFVCRFITPARLPLYKGFALRGAFGSAFKKVCCVMDRHQTCNDCFLKQQCAYFNIFETVFLESGKGKDIPRPFVLEPPYDDNGIYLEGNQITFNLILLGSAISYFPFFVMTFVEMGKKGIGLPIRRGKFLLKQVLDLSGKTLFFEGKSFLLDHPTLYHPSLFPSDGKVFVRVKILSPLRLKKGARYVGPKDFSWDVFVDVVRRRFLLLNEFYSIFPRRILDQVELLSLCNLKCGCLSWRDLERYSFRQRVRMRMGGLVGEFILELPKQADKRKKIWEILRLIELIHIGKNTTFGLGKVSVEGMDCA